jgi:hypothetical protein
LTAALRNAYLLQSLPKSLSYFELCHCVTQLQTLPPMVWASDRLL